MRATPGPPARSVAGSFALPLTWLVFFTAL